MFKYLGSTENGKEMVSYINDLLKELTSLSNVNLEKETTEDLKARQMAADIIRQYIVNQIPIDSKRYQKPEKDNYE